MLLKNLSSTPLHLLSPCSWDWLIKLSRCNCLPFSCILCTGGMDHVRVHPRFLHSNATSHKWVLGGKELTQFMICYLCDARFWLTWRCNGIIILTIFYFYFYFYELTAFAELLDNALDEVNEIYFLFVDHNCAGNLFALAFWFLCLICICMIGLQWSNICQHRYGRKQERREQNVDDWRYFHFISLNVAFTTNLHGYRAWIYKC